MLGNYIAVGLRYLWAHKSYSAINIVGLSCAMACAILSSAYIAEEYRYVNYHENGHRIYRVIREIRRDGDASFSDWVSGGSVVAMRELFPEVEVAARAGATRYTRSWLRAGDVTLSDFFCRADPELLEVFDFGFVRGELRTEPMTAVITESVARKFYGDADPIGETLTLVDAGPMGDYIITGILRDIPKYAYVPIGVLTAAPPTAFVNKEQRIWDGWASDLWGPKGYVRLPEGFQVERVEQALKEVMSRSIPKEMAQKATLHLQPMDEATLYGYGKPGQGSIHTIIFHLMIALIIAAVACANFVNLAVSRTVARAGEIASRKAIGARWSDIVVQFVTEAAVITGVALLLGFVIASFETISGFFGGNLLRPNLLDWRFILGIATAWIGVSL
ncbi:MAG: ABC transporter permease, partial [Candidatus Latescibacteria bacterium]|nr:ABC transporter permease [Candidatus Latescibacterota bacterium]